MNEFVGWLDPRVSTLGGPRAVAGGMGGPLALRGGLIPQEGPATAIRGYPRWRTTEFTSTAQAGGDAAALRLAYQRHGEGFLAYLEGPFALVVIDPDRSRLFAAIDRMGQESLFYAIVGGGRLAVATNIARLHRHAGVERRIDPQAIHDYVQSHLIPAPATLYTGIHKLQAAERVRCDAAGTSTEHYWRPAFVEDANDVDALGEALPRVLRTAVARRLHKHTGSFLSGGLDSSTITGLHAELDPEGARAYSIGFAVPGYDEIPYARIAARHFDVPLHEHYVTPDDVVAALPTVAAAGDEPFGNSSALPVLFCARLARSAGVQRLLAGDGGDELFAGNARYARQQLFAHYARLPAALRRAVVEPLLAGGSGRLPGLRKLQRYVEQARLPLPARMAQHGFVQELGAAQLFTPELLAAIDPDTARQRLHALHAAPVGASALNRLLYLDWQITLADNDLRKVSTMCRLAGVEVVYPMLDDEVVALACRVPSAQKLHRGRLRHFYKEAFRGYLPASIIDKRKQGFGLPFGHWLRDHPPLHDLARASLEALQDEGWFRREMLDELFTRHLARHPAYFGECVWILMVLSLWLQNQRQNTAARAAPSQSSPAEAATP